VIYIRKHKRFINRIRKELTVIEAELEAFEIKPVINPIKQTSVQTLKAIDESNNENASFVSEETDIAKLRSMI
jgi:hypothetical protein